MRGARKKGTHMAGKGDYQCHIFLHSFLSTLLYSLYLRFLSRLPFWLHLCEWKRVSEWAAVCFIEKLHWPRERLTGL